MYCNQCGNIVAEGALFCAFCGASTKAVSIIPANEVKAVLNEEAPAEESTSVIEEAAVPTAPVAAEESIIQPSPVSQPIQQEQPQMYTTAQPYTAPAEEIKLSQPEAVKTEKYYTFGHIALCLAAVAVMAITAGVFAGLYFSVI